MYESPSSMETSNPDEQPQTIYAELGSGGGRTGYRLKPDESNYAEVNTDGTYYPPLISCDDEVTYAEPTSANIERSTK